MSQPSSPLLPRWLSSLGRWSLLAALAVALVIPARSGDAPPRVAATTTPSTSDTLALRFPRLADSLAVRSGFAQATWDQAGRAVHGMVAIPDDAPAASAALTHFFPHTYTDGLAVRVGAMTVWTLPQGAAAVPFADDGGRAVYRDAYPATTVIHTADATRGEEFLHLADASAPTRFSYDLATATGDLRVARTAAGDLALSDGAGHQARIEAPWVVDANGVFSSAAVRWQVDPPRAGATRVTLELDASGLTYPLVIDPTWSDTGACPLVSYGHTLTLLPDGKVLATGGVDLIPNDYVTEACALYDPATGSWSATGSMSVIRAAHAAVLLRNGKVLVAGGGYTAGEVYDPATGTWSATGSATAVFYNPTLTLLPDGRVLAVGFDNHAQLYDPATNVWTEDGSTDLGQHAYHTATLLPSGRVLIVGGDASYVPLATCLLFDPLTGVWDTAASLPTGRSGHSATLLPSTGEVLVAGGHSSGGTAFDFLLYDEGTDAWTPVDVGRGAEISHHSASLLPSGNVLLARGTNNTAVEVFDATSHLLTTVATASEAVEDAPNCLLPSGQVLVTGGKSGGSVVNACHIYDDNASAGTWTATGSLTQGRQQQAMAVLPSGKALIIGGRYGNLTSERLSQCELYDPTAATWTVTGSMGSARYSLASVVLRSGKVMALGGISASGILNTCEQYDAGTWSGLAPMLSVRSAFTATALADGRVLAVGGNVNTCEIYDPVADTWTATAPLAAYTQVLSATTTLLADGRVLLVGGQVIYAAGGSEHTAKCWLYDPATTSWSAAPDLNYRRSQHRAVLLPSGRVLVVGGSNFSDRLTNPAELFDPTANDGAGAWSDTASLMRTERGLNPAVTLLADGRVLVAGGGSASEIYDEATDTWTASGALSAPHESYPTMALLPSGKVLLAGGNSAAGVTTTTVTEMFDPQQGQGSAWQPTVAAPGGALAAGLPLTVTGTGFRGLGEGGSGGSGGSSSSTATNHPLVQVRSANTDQVEWLAWDPLSSVSATSVATTGVSAAFPEGAAWLRVFVNGVPSTAQAVTVRRAQTIAFTTIDDLTYGDTFPVVAATSTSGLMVGYASSDPAIAEVLSGTLHVYGIGTVTITASQAGNSVYAAALPVAQEVEISRRPLTITASDVYVHLSDGVPLLDDAGVDYTTSDTLAYSDAFATVVGGALGATTPPTLVTGTYPLTLGTVAADNYALTLGGTPQLHVLPDNTPPEVSAPPVQTITMSDAGTALQGSYSDLDETIFGQTVTTSWSKRSGPGTVTFGGPADPVHFDRDGTYVLRLTADDGADPRSVDVTVVVSLPGTVVLGNFGSVGDGDVQGTASDWTGSSIAGFAGTPTRYRTGGYSTVIWRTMLPRGFYEIDFWKVLPGAGMSPLSLTVVHAFGFSSVTPAPDVSSPAGWTSLGIYYSDGSSWTQVRADRAKGTARISGVRFITLPGEFVDASIGDHDIPCGYGESGPWATSTVAGLGINGGSTRWTRGAGASAFWEFAHGGTGRVLLNRLVNPNNDVEWQASVAASGGAADRVIDARHGASGWVDLGRHTVAAGARLTLGHAGTQVLRADAARLALDTVVDNGDLGLREEGGGWDDSSLPNYNHSVRYSRAKKAAATWRASLAPGCYKVSRFRNVGPDSPTDVQITVTHGGGSATTVDDLTQGTSGWQELGIFEFTSGAGQVRATRGTPASTPLRVDAVRFEPVGDDVPVTAAAAPGPG